MYDWGPPRDVVTDELLADVFRIESGRQGNVYYVLGQPKTHGYRRTQPTQTTDDGARRTRHDGGVKRDMLTDRLPSCRPRDRGELWAQVYYTAFVAPEDDSSEGETEGSTRTEGQ